MDTILSKADYIEKEKIAELYFPQKEVLDDTEARDQRLHDLKDATSLGNLEHNKIKIVFEDAGGLKYTETTIWATTSEDIVLKKGITIPLHRIHRIII